MAGALSWALNLKDGMSGPGAAMSGVLSTIAGKLRAAGDASEAFRKKQEEALKANIGRDAISKIGKKHAGQEASAKSELLANMGRHDGMRDEINTAGLKRAKADAEAAAKAMDKLRAASKAASSTPYLAGQATMGKTGANIGAIGGTAPKTSGFTTLVQKLSAISPAAGRATQSIGAFLAKADGATQSVGGLDGILGKIGSGLLSVGAFALKAGAVLGAAFIGAGAAAAKYIAGIQAMKQATVFAFAASMGGQSQAIAGFEKMASTAVQIGMPLDDMGKSMTTLLARGFKFDAAETLVKQMADLKALNPAANIDSITNAIAQIKSKGKLTQEELTGQLGESLDTKLVVDALAKKLGKDQDTIKKMISEGKISSEDGIAAIQEAISKSTGGGPAGAMAEKMASTTILGGMARLQARVQRFAAGLKIDFAPVAGFLDRVGKALEGDSGKKFGAAIENALNTALGLLDKVSEKDMASVFDLAAGMLNKAASAAQSFGNAISTVDGWLASLGSKTGTLGALAGGFEGLLGASDSLNSMLNPIGLVRDALGELAAMLDKVGVGGGVFAKLAEGLGVDMAVKKQDKGLNTKTPGSTPGATTVAPSSTQSDSLGQAIRQATAPTPSEPRGASNVAPTTSTGAPGQGTAPTPAQQPRGATTITVSANGLTFEGFEQRVAEIVRAELEKG